MPATVQPLDSCHDLPEALTRSVGDALSAAAVADRLEAVPVVAASRPLEQRLQLHLALRLGSCCGLRFLQPRDCIEALTLSPSTSPGAHPPNLWSREALLWRVLPQMGNIVLPGLGLEEGSLPPRDIVCLATRLADQLDQYSHYRPELLEAWGSGRPGSSTADESWQRALWSTIRAAILAAPEPPDCPALALPRLAATLATRLQRGELPSRWIVVASGTIDPLLARCLRALSDAGAFVEVLAVLPSLDYLADLRPAPVRACIPEDPDAIAPPPGHPLLRSLGRESIGAFLLLGELDDGYTGWPDAAARAEPSGNPSTLLSRLQTSIRGNDASPEPAPASPGDLSLRLHACHGPRRELEVVCDELLRAFRDLPDLRPEEVLIAAPDLETYTNLVGAVFSAPGDTASAHSKITVRLTRHPEPGSQPTGEALAAMLAAVGGRLPASWLLDWIEHAPVRHHLGLEDDASLERARLWVQASGLIQGYDAAQRERQGLPGGTAGTWSEAIERMHAGFWFGGEPEARLPDGRWCLPLADAIDSEGNLRAALAAWMEALGATLVSWESPATPAQWSRRLADALERCLGNPELPDLAATRLQLHALAEGETLHGCAVALDAAAMHAWWAEGLRAPQGGHSSPGNHILLGDLRQLRHIPCRVLAVVGLQDSSFPRQASTPSWDLLRQSPRRTDRDPRTEDRQLFLDAILAPSERLILSATCRNPRSNAEEPFSACIEELLRSLGPDTARNIVSEHPLQPFHAKEFPQDKTRRSHDARAAAVAQALASGPQAAPALPTAAAAPAEPAPLPLKELVSFWRDPALGWLRARGAALPQHARDERGLDLIHPDLESTSLRKAIRVTTRELICGADPGRIRAQLEAERLLPRGHGGTPAWATVSTRASCLAEQILALRPERWSPADLILEDHTRICHPLTPRVGLPDGTQAVLQVLLSPEKKAHHVLPFWIQACALGAAGRETQGVPRIGTYLILRMDDDGETSLHDPPLPEPEAALQHLRNLLAGYRAGRRAPLPFAPETSRAIAQCIRQQDSTTSAPDAAACAEKGRETWLSDWGSAHAEGDTLASKLVWKNADPFADRISEWMDWAERISQPADDWWGASR